MNLNIAKLYQIASKPERRIIGLMSGTSMDGLDIALCKCVGNGMGTELHLEHFITMPYPADFRSAVKAIFSKRDADLQQVCLLNEWIAMEHAKLVLQALALWKVNPDEVDVIASHGQTIFHAPKSLHQLAAMPNATLQIGDGDHLAVHTGMITIADFRQKHLAAGGEGAPLAVYGDYLLFSQLGEDRIMLNIGGIANFTFLPGDGDATRVFSTDVGPGNTLMDHYVQKHFPGEYFDKDGLLAKSGKVNEKLLEALLDHPFFKLSLPKTTGPELFSFSYLERAQAETNTLAIGHEDVLATLCQFSATAMVNAIHTSLQTIDSPTIFLSGGGMHNSLLVTLLKSGLPHAKFETTSALNIHPDAKEAVLFALLANEALVGEAVDFGKRQGVPSVFMGKICFPN